MEMLKELGKAAALYRGYRNVKGFRSNGIDAALDFCTSGPFHTWQVREELSALVELVVERKPHNVLEIGTYHGGTLFLWCQFSDPQATIASLDLPGGEYGGGYHWVRTPIYKAFAKPQQRLRLLRGNSHSASMFERVKQTFPNGIDFLFIDGDHTYEGVKRDFQVYSSLVRNGIVAFHDICHDKGQHAHNRLGGVDRLWTELRDKYPSREFVHDWKQGWAGIGVLTV
jgi:cephalosporin hydroxylase